MPGRPKARPIGEALPPPLEHHWTVLEIATAHRCRPAAIRAAIDRGELEAIQSGKDFSIPDSAYRRWYSGMRTTRLAVSA